MPEVRTASRSLNTVDWWEDISLRRDSAKPLFRQIEEAIGIRIASGELGPGSSVPPEMVLAEHLGVARGTVRHAIEGLVARGVLERRRGKGTWVTAFLIERFLGRITSFSEDTKARGMLPGSQLLSIEMIPTPTAIRGEFGGEGDQVWRLTRLRSADGVPVAIEVCHVPINLFTHDELEHAVQGSLYEAFHRMGRPPARARLVVEAMNAGVREAQALGVPAGAACFRQRRVTSARDRTVLEMVESIYRADVYRIRVDLSLTPPNDG